MGTFSHRDMEARELMRITSPPPVARGRSCQGKTWKNFGPNENFPNGPGWYDCESGSNAWVQEVDYCGHHLPIEWAIVAAQRKQLWAELSLILWQDICNEYPGPPSFGPPE